MFWALTISGMNGMVCFGQSPLRRQVKMLLFPAYAQVSVHMLIGLQAYRAHKIAVMYWPCSGTFKLRILIDRRMGRRLSDYGKSSVSK